MSHFLLLSNVNYLTNEYTLCIHIYMYKSIGKYTFKVQSIHTTVCFNNVKIYEYLNRISCCRIGRLA